MDGQVVKAVQATNAVNVIDINSLAKGIYQVKIKTNNGIIVKSLIKQ